MEAPHDGGAGTTATGGAGGKAGGGAGGAGGKAGSGGKGGTGGKGGVGGGGGAAIKDAGCSLLTDALVDHSTTTCNALFNFETGTEGATIPGSTQAAFTGVMKSSAQTYCGTGALAIAASFSGTSGNTTKGEVDLPLAVDAGTANLLGKTITVHVSANPACDSGLRFNVNLNTTTGTSVILRIQPVTQNWSTASIKLSTPDGGVNSATTLVLQAFSIDGYVGTIYVDEVDIR